MTLRSAATGRPDWTNKTNEVAIGTPASPRQGTTKFEQDFSVAGRTTAVITLKDPDNDTEDYVVPEGKELEIGIAIMSSELPVYFDTYLVITPGVIGDYWTEGRGQVVFPDFAPTDVSAGSNINVYIINQDEEKLDFSIAINALEDAVNG